MPPTSVQTEILKALTDVEDKDFESFCYALCYGEEGPPISASEVGQKTRVQVTKLLISRCTESGALVRVIKTLRDIGCNNEALKLESRNKACLAKKNTTSCESTASLRKPLGVKVNNEQKNPQNVKKVKTEAETLMRPGLTSGYAGYEVGSHQTESAEGDTSQDPFMKHKDAVANYMPQCPATVKEIEFYRKGLDPLGFGKYSTVTHQDLYNSTDKDRKSYVDYLRRMNKTCTRGSLMEATIEYVLHCDSKSYSALDAFKVYPVSRESIQQRVALLITNIDFDDPKDRRNGGEADERNMQKLLTELGYEVVSYRNLTAKEIDDALRNFSEHPKLKETDSVFVVVMSHGKLGVVLGVNNEEFKLDHIYTHLGPEKCPALIDKPKVIIIQACRGSRRGAACVFVDSAGSEVVSDHESPDNVENDGLKYVHQEKDFISLLSCTPHTVSYRQPTKGSFLIQFIVKVFNTYSHNEHIEELFTRVMQHFEELKMRDRRQMPNKDRCSLTKLLYLFPGH